MTDPMAALRAAAAAVPDTPQNVPQRIPNYQAAPSLENPKDRAASTKIDISLFPPVAVIHGAHAMMDGAQKYGPYNWREKKVHARVYLSAAMRHILDCLDGEDLAGDSGVLHLGHAIACCAILIDAMETGNLIDDRPKKGVASAVLDRLQKQIEARLAE
jgi:hypothetical protein